MSPLKTALACTCPRCGQGRLFKGFLDIAPACESCGLKLTEHDSGDGPAVFLIFILGFTIVPAAVISLMMAKGSLWPLIIFWLLVFFGAMAALLRPAKALTVALQYKHRSTEQPDA